MVSEARYPLLPDSDYPSKKNGVILALKFNKCAAIVTSLPFLGFIFCIVYSVIYDFESSTATSCHAFNVLPSVSAAIGGYSPQKEVWKVAIILHAPIRYIMIFIYISHNYEIMGRRNNLLSFFICLLNFMENSALISLSLFDSSNYYPIHEKSFITFVFTSEVYMLLTIILHEYCRVKPKSLNEIKGLKLKKLLVLTNVISIFIAMYYFVEHNVNCNDYDYTKFAICEYIVVLSNMAYHYSSVYDFNNKDLVFRRDFTVALTNR